ncbi:hypothetical protein OLMES_4850 [Oleiphilus messinensis]|uniref:Immunity MXAN-0049 protein domain-containing protein n=2 Tax=Oleiphilus messinensis TaxID=141451 RepID=A0A1Y0IE75_9GAMM|nr:hypothetical protein OLMES_4850 [Oleiphilus messinensis]
MNYYQLSRNHFEDYGVTQNPVLPGHTSFLTGHVIHDTLPVLEFEVNYPDDVPLPHLFGNRVPLISPEMAGVMSSVGIDNFELFPALITNPISGKKWDNYLAFNVVGLVKAADMQRSSFDELMSAGIDNMETPLVAFREVVLIGEKLAGLKMFRMLESPDTLIVNETLVDALSENRPEDGWRVMVTDVDVS